MSTSVHHSLMYNQGQRQQQDTPAGPLANVVTAGSPATFSSGLTPSTLKELKRFSEGNDFASEDTSAWDFDQYAELPTGKRYIWATTEFGGWLRIDPPQAPTNVAGSTDLLLKSLVSWDYAGTSTATSTTWAVTGFIVKAYDDAGVVVDPAGQSAAGDASSLEYTGLVNRDLYTFTVTASSVVGDGPESTPSASVDVSLTA